MRSTKNCQKCKHLEAEYVIRKKDAYCQKCFLLSINHKFRTPLGKSRLLRSIKQLMIYFDPKTSASFSLLHMVKSACEDSSSKGYRFNILLVILIEFDDDKSQLAKICEEIGRLCSFELKFFSLLSYISNDTLEIFNDIASLKNSETYANCKYNEEIIAIKRNEMISKIAKVLCCDTVFTPIIADDLSVNILQDIVMGRGSQLTLNAGFIDDRYDSVKILKPLKLLTNEELAIYNEINNLPKTLLIKNNKFKSNAIKAEKILKNFIQDLQKNFPSTIFTISGFADKLKHDKEYIPCELCSAQIENRSNTDLSVKSIVKEELKIMDNYCFTCNMVLNQL